MGDYTARRVLIIEDNAMIGEMMASIVHEGGYVPLGPVASVAEAEDTLDGTLGIDGAVLDLHLDRMSRVIADRLHRLGVPFVFATGNRSEIPQEYSDRPVCEKPFTARDLLAALQEAFEGTA